MSIHIVFEVKVRARRVQDSNGNHDEAFNMRELSEKGQVRNVRDVVPGKFERVFHWSERAGLNPAPGLHCPANHYQEASTGSHSIR